jgi:hypothetical protein
MSADRHTGRSRLAHRPAAATNPSLSWPRPQPSSVSRASEVFSEHLFQLGHIQHLLGQHPLQFGVLGLQRLQPFRIGDFNPAILASPVAEGRIADPMLASLMKPAHASSPRA